jgi:hypothetical protein
MKVAHISYADVTTEKLTRNVCVIGNSPMSANTKKKFVDFAINLIHTLGTT